MPHIVFIPSADTYIAEYYPNENFHLSSALFLSRYQQPGDIYRSLITMGLYAPVGNIDYNCTILDAQLQLMVYRNEIPSGSIDVTVHRILQEWDAAFVTWNSQPLASAAPDATTSITAGYTGLLSIDVSNLIKDWWTGAFPNFGMLIKGQESSNNLIAFYGRQYINSDYYPRLVVHYIEGCLTAVPLRTILFTGAETRYSPALTTDFRTHTTFFIRNQGASNVTATVQVSNDSTWIDTPVSAVIPASSSMSLMSNIPSLYSRLEITSVGATLIQVEASIM